MNKRSEQLFERIEKMKNLKFKYKLRIAGLILFLLTMNLGLNLVSENDIIQFNNFASQALVYATNKVQDEEYIIVYVKSGDSIWKLVEENYNQISKPIYINFRDVVDIVVDLNGGSDIKSGQIIKLPKSI
ncbi:hypothetical protein [Neofamilia massiliensis]|uniref:hypothetical protein n=1 Tax=Neofamilia massiliensis TaxID=1673724 RepID=UPI0012B6BF3E|nr:hypothetical protein [Neofamilia massiliensis]